MNTCVRNEDYIAAEREQLRAALDENKWYLSERAGTDVGRRNAEADFIDRHIEVFSNRFRAVFCGRCSYQDGCPICSKFMLRASVAGW